MKITPRVLALLPVFGALMAPLAGVAQPKVPVAPSTEKSTKAAEAAEKAAEAQKAAEKAAAAQKAAEKAEVAKKAAESATVAQKSAEKAVEAQKAADKAAAAQKAAEKAAAAQKAADAAVAAQKSSEKAATVQKTVEKATAASSVTEKAAARQAAVEKLNAISKTATQAEAAQKANERAAKVAAPKTVPAAAEKAANAAAKVPVAAKVPEVKTAVVPAAAAAAGAAKAETPAPTIRFFNGPASGPNSGGKGDASATEPAVSPKNPIAEREAKEAAARKAGDLGKLPVTAAATKGSDSKAPTAAEGRLIVRETVRDGLGSLEVDPAIADKLADEAADPDKADGAKGKIGAIADAAADLTVVPVSDAKRKEVIDAVSRAEDPKAVADEKVGEAATEEVFGEDVAKLVPSDKRGKFREVFNRLADIRGSLESIGGDPDDPEVVEAVKEGATRGVTTQEESREIMEKAGQKVLDRQGFSPAKEGESFSQRIGRIAKEQEAEVAARKAAAAKLAAEKAAARAAAVAKSVGLKLGKGALTQGAAGSSAVGRSVSARVEVGIGGGKGRTSGAGKAEQGTGTDVSRVSGVGGQLRQDAASARLAAGIGGVSTAEKPTTGKNPGEAPGTPAGAPAAADVVPATAPVADVKTDAATAAPAAQEPTGTSAVTPEQDAGAGAAVSSGTSSVTSPQDDVVIGGGEGQSFTVPHSQSPDGNTGGSITYNPDGTFTAPLTTVTRDSAGNVTSSTDVTVTGTWGVDADGSVVITSTTSATTQPSAGDRGSSAADNEQSSTPSSDSSSTNQESNDKDGDGKDDDDDKDDDKGDDTPPPAEETTTEETTTETTTEESKEASTTPNPMDIGGGNPAELAIRTGGRLGGQEAKNQQRGLDLARNGGGAGGPNPNDKGSSGVLLTPEERANAARFIGAKTGNGVKDPNPLDDGGVVATERDLKELGLRGNGGAKGPTDSTGPATPQDPNSPLGGVPGIVAPGGGTRVNAQVPAASVDAAKAKVKVDAQIKEQVK